MLHQPAAPLHRVWWCWWVHIPAWGLLLQHDHRWRLGGDCPKLSSAEVRTFSVLARTIGSRLQASANHHCKLHRNCAVQIGCIVSHEFAACHIVTVWLACVAQSCECNEHAVLQAAFLQTCQKLIVLRCLLRWLGDCCLERWHDSQWPVLSLYYMLTYKIIVYLLYKTDIKMLLLCTRQNIPSVYFQKIVVSSCSVPHRSLELLRCDQLTGQSISQVARSCTSLVNFKLHNCPKVICFQNYLIPLSYLLVVDYARPSMNGCAKANTLPQQSKVVLNVDLLPLTSGMLACKQMQLPLISSCTPCCLM